MRRLAGWRRHRTPSWVDTYTPTWCSTSGARTGGSMSDAQDTAGRWHFGRSFSDTRLEDTCPCPKEPCGLVATPAGECPQHSFTAAKTMRQGHWDGNCPARFYEGGSHE